jgi:hypothetical protein
MHLLTPKSIGDKKFPPVDGHYADFKFQLRQSAGKPMFSFKIITICENIS